MWLPLVKRGIEDAQVVIVPKLMINVLRPALLPLANEFVDSVRLCLSVVVDAAEVVPMIFHCAVPVATGGEVEARPYFDFEGFTDLLCPVWRGQPQARCVHSGIVATVMPFGSTLTARQRSG